MSDVTHNQDLGRYEAHVDGELAQLVYERDGDRIVMAHTLVPPAIEGRGVASALVARAVADAAEEQLTVVPACSYVASWLRRNPEAAAGVRVASW
jgi:predicted GNAT family acetyltransferase